MSRRAAPAALVVLALLAGCEADGSSTKRSDGPPERPTAVPAAASEVTTATALTVLDDGETTRLCVGGIATSRPPQCAGIPLVDWSWSALRGTFTKEGKARWGDYVVTGGFDGESLTPTDVVPGADAPEPAYEPADFTSPCPVPEGGWRVLDPAKTTKSTQEATMRAAEALDDFSNAWVDQSINPAYSSPDPAKLERKLNNPKKLVVNVQVVDDVEGAEEALREVWGGSLCVSEADFTDDQMAAAQADANGWPGFSGSGREFDEVQVSVTYDDGSLQSWVDHEYGKGLVRIDSALVDVGE